VARDDDPLGVSPAHQQAHHAVAGTEPVHTLAGTEDLAGELEAGDLDRRLRSRLRVVAGPLEQVGPVDPGRLDLHQQVVGPRHRVGNVAVLEDLGSAGSRDHRGLHAESLSPRRPIGCVMAMRGAYVIAFFWIAAIRKIVACAGRVV
jgi:hypothetical protein